MGKTETAKLITEKAKTEAKDIAAQSWPVDVQDVNVRKTSFKFDDENQPRQKKVLDVGHLKADDITLQARNILLDGDSITASVQDAAFTEQSGFKLQR